MFNVFRGNYENKELVKVVLEKTKIYKRSLELHSGLGREYLLTAINLSSRNGKCKVLDFGGACGAEYFLIKSLLNIDFYWTVVETPEMIKQAKELATYHLKFTTRLPKNVDLVYSSGALQYLNEPYTMLEKLVKLRPKYIFLKRLVVGEEKDYIQKSRLKDNGPGPLPKGFRDRNIYYPAKILSKEKILSIFKGFRIIKEFTETAYYALLAKRL
jgi:putative methyltransferase (TIGR04325 family)